MERIELMRDLNASTVEKRQHTNEKRRFGNLKDNYSSGAS
jgi:hypothetical protein